MNPLLSKRSYLIIIKKIQFYAYNYNNIKFNLINRQTVYANKSVFIKKCNIKRLF